MLGIGSDGRIRDTVFLRPLQNPTQQLALSVLLKQQLKFQATRCGKTAVPATAIMEFPM